MRLTGYPSDTFSAFCRVDSDGTKWLMFQVCLRFVWCRGMVVCVSHYGGEQLCLVCSCPACSRQRRTDTASFYLDWASYQAGFGTPTTNNITGPSFWLGLQRLNRITSVGSWKLRVDLQNLANSAYGYELYSTFAVRHACGASRFLFFIRLAPQMHCGEP